MYRTRLPSKLTLASSDEKWVRNWFTRQRSKLAARNSKSRLAATVPIFKLHMPTRRSVSTPTDPAGSPSTTPRAHRSVSAPVSLNDPPPYTPTIPAYSRDPLCNRYPDFSQFFRPQVHERFHTCGLSAPIVQFIAKPASMHFQGLYPLPTDQRCSTNLQPCPVAFSMRLVDLLDHSSLEVSPPHRI